MRDRQAEPGAALYERLHLTGPLTYAALFDYLYCLLASTVLVSQALLGGALYISAQVGMLAVRLLQPERLKVLPRSYRAWGVSLTALAAATPSRCCWYTRKA